MRTFSIVGVCDWCKKPSMVIKHEYVDGKCNYSCEQCASIASFDVREFNLAELEMRNKQNQNLRKAS